MNNFSQDKSARGISFFAKVGPVVVDESLIQEIKSMSVRENHKSVRVCLHGDPSEVHHDMVILEYRGHYLQPHRHPDKTETIHVIEGEFAIYRLSEEGKVLSKNILKSGQLMRLTKNDFYFGQILSPFVIYHESKQGPYVRETDSIVPAWAPAYDDTDAILKFQNWISTEA